MNTSYIEDLVNRLRELKINCYGLMIQAQRAHWDVTGPSFSPLHSLFQEGYEFYFEMIDNTAERIRQLGQFTNLTVLDISQSKYTPFEESLDSVELVQTVSNNLGEFIEDIRNILSTTNETNDFATTNWLSDVIEVSEKLLWRLKANL